MDALERPQHLADDVDRHVDGHRSAVAPEPPEQAIGVDPVDVLHRQVGLAGVAEPGAVHRDHVLVLHRGVERRLALEHRPPLRIGEEVRQQTLDDQPRGLGLRRDRAGEVDFGRASYGDASLQEVRSKLDRSATNRLRHPTFGHALALHDE